MKVRNRVAMPLISLLVVIGLAGCQLLGTATPAKPGEDIIREGISKLIGVTSFSYEVALKGDVKDETGAPVKFDLNLGGQLDVKDAKDPKAILKVAGTVSDGSNMSGNGSFDLRLNKEALYFDILKLTVEGSSALPPEVTDMFNKWWKITLPAGTLDEIVLVVPPAEDAKMTPEQLKFKKIMDETSFFGKPVFVGVENVKGEDCYHYSVTLDKKAFIAFMKKLSELNGDVVTDSDLSDAEKSFEKIDITGDAYVGVKSALMQQLSLTIKMAGGTGEPSGTFTVSLKLWDVGKTITFEAPKDATEFPVEDFVSGFMGASAAPATGAASDISPYDSVTTDFPADSGLVTDPAGSATEPATVGAAG